MTGDLLAERAALLAEGSLLRDRLAAMSSDDWVAAQDLRDKQSAIVDRYLALLPEVAVARSPDTGEVVRWRIDTAGLDGWFWRHEASEREDPDPMPGGWLAMNGAMRLAEPVEFTSFQAIPGPGVPFVVPRLLDVPRVRAVITEVPVGRHTGWAITYFGTNPDAVELVNTWGSDTHYVYDAAGTWLGWNMSLEHVSDYDFELERWLRSGRLLWIAPGDDSATLRQGVDGCPYLDLPGPRQIAYVQFGEVEYASSA